ncbi:MAG: 50S ribosomal protein L29 [Actinobacteria bacterium]|nr:50S ribosomal protein L29 [Actinomycetota bacterium]MBI3256291.1 50S ribosomal protein L29 [Actinomycetota bacterium]
MMSTTSDLRSLSDQELLSRLEENRHELFTLRFRHATGQLENTSRLGSLRREIARMTTLLREREIAAAEALEAHANG